MVDVVNPYRSPRSHVTDAPAHVGALRDAGRGRRFLTLLVDCAGWFALLFVLLVAVVGVYDSTGERTEQQIDALLVHPAVDALAAASNFAYHLLFEALTARTLGKLVTGTRVVREDSGRPGFGALLGRTAARHIPFEPFSIFRASGRCWHDTQSKTRVVRVR